MLKQEQAFKVTRSRKRMRAAADEKLILMWTVLRGKEDSRAALAYCGPREELARTKVELLKHGGQWRKPMYNTGNDDEWWVNSKGDFIQLQLHVVET